MQTAVRQAATVQAGGVVQVTSPDLPDGAEVEVIILFKSPIDISDTWSEVDMRDVTRYSLARAAADLDDGDPDA